MHNIAFLFRFYFIDLNGSSCPGVLAKSTIRSQKHGVSLAWMTNDKLRMSFSVTVEYPYQFVQVYFFFQQCLLRSAGTSVGNISGVSSENWTPIISLLLVIIHILSCGAIIRLYRRRSSRSIDRASIRVCSGSASPCYLQQ
jgi:hypothetical protein